MNQEDFEDDSKKPDLARLRRFALTTGLILILYSVAGGKLKSPGDIQLLGFHFEVTRLGLLEICLPLISFYAALRYWYYGIQISLTRYKKRDIILRCHVLPPGYGLKLSDDPALKAEQVVLIIRELFPRMNIDPGVLELQGGQVKVNLPSLSWKTRLLTSLENVDYTFPVWVNSVAIITYVIAKALCCLFLRNG